MSRKAILQRNTPWSVREVQSSTVTWKEGAGLTRHHTGKGASLAERVDPLNCRITLMSTSPLSWSAPKSVPWRKKWSDASRPTR
jgi:hypothetical protein